MLLHIIFLFFHFIDKNKIFLTFFKIIVIKYIKYLKIKIDINKLKNGHFPNLRNGVDQE